MPGLPRWCAGLEGGLLVLLTGYQPVGGASFMEVACHADPLIKYGLEEAKEERSLGVHQVERVLAASLVDGELVLRGGQGLADDIDPCNAGHGDGDGARSAGSDGIDRHGHILLPWPGNPVLCPEMGDLVHGLYNVAGLLRHLVIGIGHRLVGVRVPRAENEALRRHEKGYSGPPRGGPAPRTGQCR